MTCSCAAFAWHHIISKTETMSDTIDMTGAWTTFYHVPVRQGLHRRENRNSPRVIRFDMFQHKRTTKMPIPAQDYLRNIHARRFHVSCQWWGRRSCQGPPQMEQSLFSNLATTRRFLHTRWFPNTREKEDITRWMTTAGLRKNDR
jgi:hypothetical protein